MSNIAKLKKKAAEFEARKQYEKALEVYEQALTATPPTDEERDVPLYNRVGDLHYRLGNSERAIGYYEQAADLYAEGGFFNNAIALCNKILRYSPGRTIVYYKLGIISAKKGFNSDAKQNFLEYADRMQRVGKMDEAFRALKEFADLCPGQDDVRLMLAEQLSRADRKIEALEQLELLYETLEADGRSGEAAATLERMKAIDPVFKPKRSVTPRARKKEGLVFLDLDFSGPAPTMPKDHGGFEATPEPPPVRDYPAAASADPADITAASQGAEDMVEVPAAEAPIGLELTSLADEPVAAGDDVEPDMKQADETPSSSSNQLKFITPAAESGATAIDSMDFNPLGAPPLPFIDGGRTLDVELEDPDDFGSAGTTSNGSSDADFIDLGEWLERNRTPTSTRMVTHDEAPENEEQKDFGEMLDKFKAGISRNVDEEDFESHYDLGIAFREMGLLDDAIGSFQKSSRGPSLRVRASEAIGQCFMDKGEAGVTMTVLERLVRDRSMSDGQLVGVLYLLGRAAESLSRESEAATYYQRVLAVQIGFRDAADRLSSLTQTSR
jgi:tetratricopeptide (TPR) repeat protein